MSFSYDPFGRRIQKSSSSGATNYFYDGVDSTQEVDASGVLLARYTKGDSIDEPLAELRTGTVSYYDQDGLGSVTSLSTLSAGLANTYLYDTFGNLTASTGSFGNPFQYTGRDFDSETGLRYYRARYYDSSTGRFISEDPVHFNGGGVNFYRYVNNNPTTFTDSSGLSPDCKNCRIVVRCRPIEKYHGSVGMLGAEHCDARVIDANGAEHSLSAGPIGGYLDAWDTPGQKSGPFTGAITYYNARAKCDTANCLITATQAYQAANGQGTHSAYHIFGPNSNDWLNSTFGSCSINLNLDWFGSPIFSLPFWQGK